MLLANGNPVASRRRSRWPPLGALGRSVQEAVLPVRRRRRQARRPVRQLHHRLRPQRATRHLRRTGQARPVPARHGRAARNRCTGTKQRFGLECDLDHYMIVAVGDFNMGAMENKGLNIFNTKYVLARSDVATDVDFENIDRVVAHEYFHNWTGNRVTCRDWFQLSLKEGLTVFRDQEFGADLHNRQIARIREVRGLRAGQFPEDAGPMSHPVRPSSFVEINNFYTATVYEKGAEVIRMIQTLIGRDGFRKGMDEYFRRHDGQAVTCEDFVAAMAAASRFRLHAIHALVQPARYATCCGQRPFRCRNQDLHADLHASQPARQRRSALPDPDPRRAVHRARRADRRQRAPAATHRQHAILRLQRHRRRADALPAARFLGAGLSRLRLHAGTAHPAAGARKRPVQRLGSRPAPRLDADSRRHGGHRRRPGSRSGRPASSTPPAACCKPRPSVAPPSSPKP